MSPSSRFVFSAPLWAWLACATAAQAAEGPPADPARERAEAQLEHLTVEQKVGQLMMVGFAGLHMTDDIAALVRGRQVGGVCMFKRNIEGPEQIAVLNEDLRELMADSVPLFIAVDQEGGNVVRISRGALVLPGNMALGATRSAQLAYDAGKAQAEDLKLLGFNMNLAPVLDVNVNPRNPVIGIRSFGDNPALVSAFGAEFIRGQQDGNIATVAKHFPGHGGTDVDSHRGLPVMKESKEQVMAQLEPFATAIRAGLDGLMTAHVSTPTLTGDDLPATLSPKILTGLLRGELGFDGLVLTDELEMEAIAQRFGVGKAAVMAVTAGADMVLIPWTPEKKLEVQQALLAAAASGEITRERLDAAVRHVLVVKARRGLFSAPPPLEQRLSLIGRRRGRSVSREISQASVTLLRSGPQTFPLKLDQKVAVLTAEPSFANAIRLRDPHARALVTPAYPSSKLRAELRQKARELALWADVVVVGVINSRQVDLVTMAAAARRPVVVVTMGLPYLVELVPEAQTVLAVYSYRESAAEAAAAALYGERGTPGKLPVSLPHFPFGHGTDPVGDTQARRAAAAEP